MVSGRVAASRAFAIALSLLAIASPAMAEEPDAEAEARALFFEAHEAAKRGDAALACTKFEESLALFRRASTLLNLGDCYDDLGRTATALSYWREGAALLESADERMALAKLRIGELDALAPRLRVRLPPSLPERSIVQIGDQASTATSLPDEIRLDPGVHEIILQAPDHLSTRVTVTLVDGETRQIDLTLGARTVAQPIVLRGPTEASPAGAMAPPATATGGPPMWVWPVGVLGLVSALASVPFAVDYANTLERQDERCGGDLERCSPTPAGSYDPAEDNSRKERDAILGVVLGSAGGVALVAALVGALTGGSSDGSQAGISVWTTGARAGVVTTF